MSGGRKVLIVCPQVDRDDVGENLCGYEWISRLSKICDVTLLTQRFPGHVSPSKQLPGVRAVEWDSTGYLSHYQRFNSAVKPWYPSFYFRTRKWIAAALARGEQFELFHQIMPMATRYPSPCVGFGVPFIVGPVGGGVATPESMRRELGTEPGFMKLRDIDAFRLRYDPLLRRTYEEAASIICCSGYAAERLSAVKTRRIDLEYEVGIEALAPEREIAARPAGELRMLYAGRIIRTKGLRDAIRAMARLTDLPKISLDVAGSGEDMTACQHEAESLGVATRVRFLGRLPRAELEPLYRSADVFVFPSFREPTGGVLFECMRHGLPAIVASNGGPGHIVTDACGFRVDPVEPGEYAGAIAGAIRRMAEQPELRGTMGDACRERIAELGLWERKLERVSKLYDEVCRAPSKTRSEPVLVSSNPMGINQVTSFERPAAAKRGIA